MVGVAYNLDPGELDAAIAALGVKTRVIVKHERDLNAAAGGVIESATKRRIAQDKRAPDGTPWALWSRSGPERRPGQTILFAKGKLNDSIATIVSARQVEVGTNLVYGAIHQFGGDTSQGHPDIPARPYLGLSDDDRTDLIDVVTDFLRARL